MYLPTPTERQQYNICFCSSEKFNAYFYQESYKFNKMRLSNLIKTALLLVTVISLSACAKDAQLSLPAIFSDNMVLQQNSNAAIWGKATPGTEVTVTGNWGATASATAAEDSTWLLNLPTTEAGGPYVLTVSAHKSSIAINNVLLGEVWLGSGQSNMEMPLEGWPPNDLIMDSEAAIAASENSEIRMFTVVRNTSAEPLEDVTGDWQIASPETSGRFSATAYFFARKLNAELKVPVGIIHSSWGGTPAEAWVSGKMLAIDKDFSDVMEKMEAFAPQAEVYNEWLNQHPSTVITVKDNVDPLVGIDLFDAYCVNPATTTEEWPVMAVPGTIEQSAIGAFDGAVWLRREIEIPAAWEGQSLLMDLGPIDDRDVTYFNGTRVGGIEESGFWQAKRQYTIPSELVTAGKAVIAVRVIDNQGGGGFTGQPQDLKIAPENQPEAALNLAGEWPYQVVAELKGDKLYLLNPETNDFASRPALSMSLTANTPSALYNAMIAPLTPYTIKGAIWYQGETNVGRAHQYMRLKSMLVTDWRNEFNNPDLSFYYVQLAPWHNGNVDGNSSAHLREAQRRMMDLPNTGMISTMDIGDVMNIHPANKTDVGERLALWALANNYQMDLVFSGPIPAEKETQGNALHLSFKHTADALVINEEVPNQFEIAGEDGVFYPAKTEIMGDALILTSSEVKAPMHARYAYKNGSEASLFNSAGLPAPSFSTEDEIAENH
jgi:sialate O-acetylesterase